MPTSGSSETIYEPDGGATAGVVIRRRTGLTVVNGETNFTRFDLREVLLCEAGDV